MAFIIVSNLRAIEVTVERDDGEFVLLQTYKGQRFMVRRSRLFNTYGDALSRIAKRDCKLGQCSRQVFSSPYDYEPGGPKWQH